MSFFDAADLEHFNPEGALESAIEQKPHSKISEIRFIGNPPQLWHWR